MLKRVKIAIKEKKQREKNRELLILETTLSRFIIYLFKNQN